MLTIYQKSGMGGEPNIMLQDSINIAKLLTIERNLISFIITLIYACHDTQVVTITYNYVVILISITTQD